MNDNKPIKAYKGFNKDLTCRGFQYEVGKEYEHKGTVSMCNSGFHACENPMDVLSFYPPCDNNGTPRRYCEVEQSGTLDRSEDDKVCSSRIRVIAEIRRADGGTPDAEYYTTLLSEVEAVQL